MSKSTPNTFCVSNEEVVTYNGVRIRVITAGIDTSAFESNPVMLHMHKRGKVFGGWASLRKEGAKMFADPEPDAAALDDEIKLVADQVNRGIIKAASIAVDIDADAVVFNEELNCLDCTRTVLEEISIVDIGAIRSAVRLMKKGEALTSEMLTELQLCAQAGGESLSTTHSQNPNSKMNFKRIALAAGLEEAATEDQLAMKIAQLTADAGYKTKYETLKGEQDAAQLKLSKEMVDAAVTDGRIPAKLKDNYLKLAAHDFDGTRAVLEAMPKPKNLVEFAKQDQGAEAAAGTKEEAIKLYDQLDKSNGLGSLKLSKPEEFARIFEAKWGKKPS